MNGRAGWWRAERLAALLVLLVLTAGTVGYVAVEGWTVWDAFFMTVTTVTTVGYRELHPLSPAGQVFTAALIISGVATVLYAFSLLMAMVVEGRLYDQLGRRRRARMIEQLDHHFVVCGFGRIGRTIAQDFRHRAVPFVIVEKDPDRVRQAVDLGFLAVEGDASHEDVLREARVESARGLIAAVGTDAENVYTVLSARLLQSDLFIVSRAESEESRTKLERAGANRVLSPYEIGALQLAQTALRPAVVDFVQFATSSANLELNMEEVVVAAGTSLDGQSLQAAALRQRFGVIVVAIQRADGRMEFNPAAEAVIRGGDHLIALGPPDSLRDLERAAGQ